MAATRAATLVGGDGIAGGDVCLVIIDPQNDFHDGGSLAVPGADERRGPGGGHRSALWFMLF